MIKPMKLKDKYGSLINSKAIITDDYIILCSANSSENNEYNKGLTRILELFGENSWVLEKVILDSTVSIKLLGEEDNRLIIPHLTPISDFSNKEYIRKAIQKEIARLASRGTIGGNPQKRIKLYIGNRDTQPAVIRDISNISKNILETVRKRLIDSRLGQGQFRYELENLWKSCPVTGLKTRQILRASHIKPWALSTNEERLDPYNGILLSANIDALFDKGLLSFKDDGSVIVSDMIENDDLPKLGVKFDCKVEFKDRTLDYIQYHREYLYIK